MSEPSRRVVVIAMGGTIAMVPAESGGVKVGLQAEELAAGADRKQIVRAVAVAGGYAGSEQWPWRMS